MQGLLLQVDVAEIVMHEAYDPDAVVDFLEAYTLAGQRVGDADLLAVHADATDLGLSRRRDQQAFASPNLLDTLRAREIANVARKTSRETGLTHRPTIDGVSISGTYRRSINLASGRFAMLDNGLGFALVPWRPVVEKALGRTISVVMRGGEVSWNIGRQRGIGRLRMKYSARRWIQPVNANRSLNISAGV